MQESHRLYGVMLYDQDGRVVLEAGFCDRGFGPLISRVFELKPHERLVGVRSKLDESAYSPV